MNNKTLNPEAFYGQLSSEYDHMIRFENRLKAERPVFEKLIEKYPIKSVLDAACGTGMHVIMLNQLSINVLGADISPDMLDQAEKNAKRWNCDSRFILSSMQKLDQKITNTFDAIYCLGNSLPHLLQEKDLRQALSAFHKLLNPGGIVVIGMINFARVRRNNERILSVNRTGQSGGHSTLGGRTGRTGDTEFIRFYDIGEESFYFNILTINWQNGKAAYQLQTTELKPYTQPWLETELSKTGFHANDFFGSLHLEPFIEEKSKNLVIISRK